MSDAGLRAALRRRLALRAEAPGDELSRGRRRRGLILVAMGVLVLAAQSRLEWLLPYNPASLEAMRRLLLWPDLQASELVWLWAWICLALLAGLTVIRWPGLLAVATGLALGSAHATAGGGAASLTMLLLVGVASLGWHAWRDGGLALLIATGLSVVAWELSISQFASLWILTPVLVFMFLWIDFQSTRAQSERDGLIASLDERSAELTELQGARTQLLASISHDLRQPLQAVRLYAEALQGMGVREGEAARRAELLRQQMRAADDAVAMLDQFSEFSAIEQGALQ